MLPFEGGQTIGVGELADAVLRTSDIEGITLLGGEPFGQAAAAAALCETVRARSALSILVFTGYTLRELKRDGGQDARRVLACCDLLVDGRYEPRCPDQKRRWIGSQNQELHFLSSRYVPEDPRFRAPNTLEIRFGRGELTVNGWPAGADNLLD